MKSDMPLPLDYAFWDTMHSFPEWQVICLWSELEPSIEFTSDSRPMAVQEKLTAARKDDRVGSEVRRLDSDGKTTYEIWYHRSDLLAYANLIMERPLFLFPDQRTTASPFGKRQRQISRQRSADTATSVDVSQASDTVAIEATIHGNTMPEGRMPATRSSRYLTVKQAAEKYPFYTEKAIWNLVFKASTRQSSKGVIPGNGLDAAVIRVNRKVLLDDEALLKWIESHRQPGVEQFDQKDKGSIVQNSVGTLLDADGIPAVSVAPAEVDFVKLNTKPLQRQRYQEQEILRMLKEAGFNPKDLPPRLPGKSGAKDIARRGLPEFTVSQFNKAWERLRNFGEIEGAN